MQRNSALTVPSGSVRVVASNASAEIAMRIIKSARKTGLSWLERGWPVNRSPFFEPIHTQSIRHSHR